MQIISQKQEIFDLVRRWRQQDLSVGLVPTMGCLHQGHMALVRFAQSRVDRLIVYVFTNPSQFNCLDDYLNYPKTPEADKALLQAHKVDALFMPTEAEIYPNGFEHISQVQPPQDPEVTHLENIRPGHFQGVLTVLTKMFNIMPVDQAFFGEKDYDQLALVKRLAKDLDIPITISAVPTVRENDGLAMSSRNTRLTESERQLAPLIYRTLTKAQDYLAQALQQTLAPEAFNDLIATIEQQSAQELNSAGFKVDYFRVLSPTLKQPTLNDAKLTILTAAHLGKVRLIDNLTTPDLHCNPNC